MTTKPLDNSLTAPLDHIQTITEAVAEIETHLTDWTVALAYALDHAPGDFEFGPYLGKGPLARTYEFLNLEILTACPRPAHRSGAPALPALGGRRLIAFLCLTTAQHMRLIPENCIGGRFFRITAPRHCYRASYLRALRRTTLAELDRARRTSPLVAPELFHYREDSLERSHPFLNRAEYVAADGHRRASPWIIE